VSESRPGGSPEKVGNLVARFLDDAGMSEQMLRHDALDAWPGVVGEAIAGVTHARSLSVGTLFVEVRSSAWLMELEMMKLDILRRLNAGRDEGRIDRIVFVLGESR